MTGVYRKKQCRTCKGIQFATHKAESESTRIQREGGPTRIHRRTNLARFEAVKPDEWVRL